MACVSRILAGLFDECETSKGGIKKILISTENPKPIVELNIISSFSKSVEWYEYDFKKNTSSFTSNYTIDNTNGVNYVTTELVLQVNKMNTVKRIEMAGLAVNEMYIIVLDNNNKYWYLGYDEPVTATTGNSLTGTVKTDGNFYQITFTDESSVLPYEVDKNVIETLYKNKPLKFTAVQNSSISIDFSEDKSITLYATKDFVNILTITTPGWSTTLNEGESIYIYGDNPSGLYNADNDRSMTFGISGLVDLSGNIMTLIGEDATEIPEEYCFTKMFLNCKIRTAPELPAKKLTTGCYDSMFMGCPNLVSAPELPATELADYCYRNMFLTCGGLKTAPKKLPAKILAEECYFNMFVGCTSLTSAPMLPATTLAMACYQTMFLGCTSLTSAPELPATELAEECYQAMFVGCSSLINAPALPAEELATSCYKSMFQGCTSLAKAPALPAMQLAEECYYNMFLECISLTEAPMLPALNLAQSCYYGMFAACRNLSKVQDELSALMLADSCYLGMFNSCSSLVKAPELPAIVLAPSCYQGMFIQCDNLEEAPVLPAAVLAQGCYSRMFSECSKLNYIEMRAEQLATDSLFDWVSGVAENGTFKKKSSLNLPFGSNGIPTGWTVEAVI